MKFPPHIQPLLTLQCVPVRMPRIRPVVTEWRQCYSFGEVTFRRIEAMWVSHLDRSGACLWTRVVLGHCN